ncbi:MAG: DNA/RNA non-specific endonuclease [Clostridia bacterium]|nr:DNA/RNA non-specific endonuclease [Clostridia bacterium]
MKNRISTALLALLLALSLLVTGCEFGDGARTDGNQTGDIPELEAPPIDDDDVPDPSPEENPADPTESIYAVLNGNKPYFEADDITDTGFELFSELDELGRCGVAFACVGTEMMPTEQRDFSLSSVSPSGWSYGGKSNNNTYDTSIVPGGYIYNRCHLIGYQLTGETTNKQNLITGTKQFNIKGMLPFENMVADFVKETGYHVMYRVTPIYEDYNLLASGAIIEAYSVEDEGDGICFCVYVYNIQPGIEINYFTGENKLEGDDGSDNTDETVRCYVINISSKKLHLDTCSTVKKLSAANREDFEGTIAELKEKYPDYSPCGTCKPFN